MVATEGGHAELDGYERLTLLGRGPRSEVWRARSRTAGTEVALKLFAPAVARRPDFVTLFEKETSALAALRHKNILPVHQRGKVGETFFLSVELVQGGSLRAMMRSGAVAAAETGRIGIQICDALDLAHTRATPHRNLVAENVFIDASGTVKVSALVHHHLAEIARRERRAAVRVTQAALDKLLAHRWPGNVRELVNIIERAILHAEGGAIDAPHIVLPNDASPVISAYRDAKEEFEHAYYSQALRITGGNITLVAKLAQKTRKEVYDALRRLDLAAGEYRESSSRMLAAAPVPEDDPSEPS